MATLSYNDIAKSIYLLAKDKKGAELQEVLRNTVAFLHRRRLLSKSGEILARLKKIADRGAGIQEVKLSSAEAVSETTKKHLKDVLKHRYKAEQIHFMEELNPNLIGGVRLEANDEVIDLTVKNKIEKLKEHLTR